MIDKVSLENNFMISTFKNDNQFSKFKNTYIVFIISFSFPTSRQVLFGVRKEIHETNKIRIVLIFLKNVCIATNFAN